MFFDQFEAISQILAGLAINAIWQSALIAAAVWTAMRFYAPAAAAARERVWIATLAAVVLLPAISWLSGYGISDGNAVAARLSFAGPRSIGSPADEFAASMVQTSEATETPALSRALDLRLPESVPASGLSTMLVVFAIGLAVVRLARLATGVGLCGRLRRSAEPAGDDLERRLTTWREVRTKGRAARLCVSDLVHQPAMLGFADPLVLLPRDLPAKLSDQDLDHVALHELAHVRRHDDWALAAQRFIEALFVFNPVVFWVGRRLELEREAACDEWVVSVTGRPRHYARSLLTLAEMRLSPASAGLVPGALKRRSHLADRVERLVAMSDGKRPRTRFACAASMTTAAATLAACALFAPAVGFSNAAAAPGRPVFETPAVTPAADIDDTRFEDPKARQAAVAALAGRPGTVIVMDPRTGRVLTIVNQQWAVRQSFTPASTIKLVTALAALDMGSFDPARRLAVHDTDRKLDLDEALAYSNNEYFQRVGEGAGFERFARIAREAGFGEKTGVNLPGEIEGRVPAGPDARTLESVFGAGTGCEVTPIQLATFISAFANGGRLLEPLLVATDAPDPEPRVRRDLNGRIPDLQRLVPGLRGALAYGTAKRAADARYPVAGKTGTANLPGGERLGLFMSWHDVEESRLAVVVVMTGDVTGATAAGVAALVYKALLDC